MDLKNKVFDVVTARPEELEDVLNCAVIEGGCILYGMYQAATDRSGYITVVMYRRLRVESGGEDHESN